LISLRQGEHGTLWKSETIIAQAVRETIDDTRWGGLDEARTDVSSDDVLGCQISVVDEADEVAHTPIAKKR